MGDLHKILNSFCREKELGELIDSNDLLEELWDEEFNTLVLGEMGLTTSNEGVSGFKEGLFGVANHHLEIGIFSELGHFFNFIVEETDNFFDVSVLH